MSRYNAAVKDQFGMTPLHRAAVFGHVDTILLLLDMGAMINAQNDIGYSPLHYATSNGHVDSARLLLQKGADYSLRNNIGNRPFDDNFATGGCTAMDLLVSIINENEALKVQGLQSAQELLEQKAVMEEEHKKLAQMNEELKKHEEQLNLDLDDNINAWQTEIDGLTEKIAVLEKKNEELIAKNKRQQEDMEAQLIAAAHNNRGIKRRMVDKLDKGTRRLAGLRPSDGKGLRKFVKHDINMNENSSTVESRADNSTVRMGEEEEEEGEQQQQNPQAVQSYTEGSLADEAPLRLRSSSTTSWGRMRSRSLNSKNKVEEVVSAVEPFESACSTKSAVCWSFDIMSSFSSASKKKDEDEVAVTGPFEPTSALFFNKSKEKPQPESPTASSLTQSRSSASKKNGEENIPVVHPLDATSSNKTKGKLSPETATPSSVSRSLLSTNTKKHGDGIVAVEPFEPSSTMPFNKTDQQPNPVSFVPGKVDNMRSFWLAASQKNKGEEDVAATGRFEPSSAFSVNKARVKPRFESPTDPSLTRSRSSPSKTKGEEDIFMVRPFESTRSLSFNKNKEKTRAEADKEPNKDDRQLESSWKDTFGTSLDNHESRPPSSQMLASSSDKKQQAVSTQIMSQQVLSTDADASLISPSIFCTSLNCTASSFSTKPHDEIGAKSSMDEGSLPENAPLSRFTTDGPVPMTSKKNEQKMEKEQHELSQKSTTVVVCKKIDKQDELDHTPVAQIQPSTQEDNHGHTVSMTSKKNEQKMEKERHELSQKSTTVVVCKKIDKQDEFDNTPVAQIQPSTQEDIHGHNKVSTETNRVLSPATFSRELQQHEQPRLVRLLELQQNQQEHQLPTPTEDRFSSTKFRNSLLKVIERKEQEQQQQEQQQQQQSPREGQELKKQYPQQPLPSEDKNGLEQHELALLDLSACPDLSSLAALYKCDIQELSKSLFSMQLDKSNIAFQNPLSVDLSAHDKSSTETLSMFMKKHGDQQKDQPTTQCQEKNGIDQHGVDPPITPSSNENPGMPYSLMRSPTWLSSFRLPTEPLSMFMSKDERDKKEISGCRSKLDSPVLSPTWSTSRLAEASNVDTDDMPPVDLSTPESKPMVMSKDEPAALDDDENPVSRGEKMQQEEEEEEGQEVLFFGMPTGETAWNAELFSSSLAKTPHQEQDQIEETVIMIDDRDELDQFDKEEDAAEDAAPGLFTAASSSSHLKLAKDKMTESSRDTPQEFDAEEETMTQTKNSIVDSGEANKNGGLHFGTQQLADEFNKHQRKQKKNKLKRAIRSIRGTFRKKHSVSGQ